MIPKPTVVKRLSTTRARLGASGRSWSTIPAAERRE
jgi:hypothetical protein